MRRKEALAIAEPIARAIFTGAGANGRVIATRLQFMDERDRPLGLGWCESAIANVIADKLMQYDRLIRPARKAKAKRKKARRG